jgi:hypothetical protein
LEWKQILEWKKYWLGVEGNIDLEWKEILTWSGRKYWFRVEGNIRVEEILTAS